MKIIDQELISEKSKKGLIASDLYTPSGKGEGRASPENQNDLLALMQDSTFSGVIIQQTAKLSQGSLIYRGDEKKVKKAKELMKTLKEPRLRRKVYPNLLIYTNAFLEIVYKGKKADNLALLETREMEIVDKPNGTVIGYVQENQYGKIAFMPNQVIHLKSFEVTTDNWGYAYNKNLVRIVNAKLWLQNYLHWLVKTNQFRTIFNAKDAGDRIQDFLTYLRQAENHPTKHLVVEGDVVQTILRDFKDGDSFINLINYYNSEIYRLMQTPPIVAGTVDNSNRSNSEAQLDSTYYSWLNYIRGIYLDYLNNDILPLFGINDIEVKFTPLDGTVTKSEIEVTSGLKELGMNMKGLTQHLEDAGFEFNEGVELEEPEPMAIGGFGQGTVMGKPPSRQPQDNFGESKTGKESSTRPEQIGQKSKPIDFNKYPYVMS